MNIPAAKRPSVRFGIICPHCGSPAHVRSSRSLTILVRSYYMACTNLDCGYIFGAQFEVTHTISPPANPNPNVFLRGAASAKARRERRAARWCWGAG